MNLTNWLTILKTRRNCDLPREGRSSRFACVNRLEVLVRPANFSGTVMAFLALEVLQMALLLSPFATSHLLNSRFGRIGALEHHNLPSNASPAGSLGTGGQTRLSVLATAVPTATGPCQLPHPLPLTNKGTLERFGSDEYRNVVDPFSSFVGIEETDLLERSYVDYFEGSESVIVKGSRLRANVQFWESIGASLFDLSVIREGYKIPFYYTPTSVFLPNNKSALRNADFVLCAITELLKVGSVVQCPCPPVVVKSLSVSIHPNGKKRLILDLRHVNFFVKKSKIKFEDATMSGSLTLCGLFRLILTRAIII